ncbi:energy transducer TonB [Agitococcus lubricus]|uniref:Protein TonB n=1 Tax=Agitococcus lubricus TaxID=1077255 RepID=A0A2T5J2L7_9GAMM|nr:energy transducer TonB [Agitococcus lubricus]PTQ90770.1 protein TonB [Agitococcus lubricus]
MGLVSLLANNNSTHANPNHLAYAIFAAVMIHAFIIMGVTFVAPANPPQAMMEVTVALHRSPTANQEADFLAQANQAGGGQLKNAREITTTQAADFYDAQINEIKPEDNLAFAPPPEPISHRLIVTHHRSVVKIPPSEHKKQPPTQQTSDGLLQMSAQSAAIASLEARLAEKRQAYAKKTKVHTVSSVSARQDMTAAYIDGFRQKVEKMGNLHYPDIARSRRLQGEVRLLVAILPNGTVKQIEVRSSSGYGILDEAAKRSVKLAEPFQVFSPDMRKNIEVLQIIRTWRFAEKMHNEQ